MVYNAFPGHQQEENEKQTVSTAFGKEALLLDEFLGLVLSNFRI